MDRSHQEQLRGYKLTPEELKVVLDFGAQGIGLFLLIKVWLRLNEVTDRMFIYLERAQQERQQLLDNQKE